MTVAAELLVRVGADTSPAESQIQSFRGQLQQGAADLGKTGAYLTAAVSAPIIGIGMDAVRTAADFQQSMARVGAISRASESDLALLTAAAEDLGRTTSFSASEAADGMSFLAMAGFEVNETIAAMPGLLSLAAAGQTDLATTADIASNVLSAMGWEAERTTDLADILTATFTRSNTSLEQLGSAMSYVAPQSANLGISMEQTAAAIGLLGDAGIQGTRAGTGLNAVLTRLGAPTTAAADAMEDLGVSVFDAAGNMHGLPEILGQFERALDGMTDQQRTAALSQIFDTRALTSFSILLGAGSERLDEFASSMDSVKASDIAAMQLDTLEGQIKLLNSALEGLKITVGNAVLPALQELASRAGPVITRVTEWFESLDRNAQMAGFAFLGLAAAAGPVMLALAGIAAGVAFLLSPIGLVVAGTAALGAAWVADFLGMRTATMGFVDSIRGLVSAFQDARDRGLEPLRAAFFTLQNALEGLGLRWLSDALGDFETAAAGAWRRAVDFATNLDNWPGPLRAVAAAVATGVTALSDFVSHVQGVIADSATFRDALVTLGRQGFDFLATRVAALVSNAQARLEPLEAAFQRITTIMAGIAAGDLEPAREALRDAFDAIASFDMNAFVSTLSSAGADVSTAILNSFRQIDLPALRDTIIARLGLENFQLFPDGLDTSFDWSSVRINTAALVSEVQSQLADIDFSGAATAVRARVTAAFAAIDWQTASPIDVSPLVAGIQRGFETAQQQLSAALSGDNPLSRFFERVRAVADDIADNMAGFGSAPIADRFSRVVSSVLATVGLIGETRFDLIQTATRHLSSLTTSLLEFGAGVVEGLDAEKIAAVLGGVAVEWSNQFAAVFEGADLFDMASAAGSLASSFVNKLGEVLGAPDFGEQVGGAITSVAATLAQASVQIVTGIVDGISDIEFSQFAAGFGSFAQGFVQGVNDALAEADFSVSTGGRDAMTLAIQDSIIQYFGDRIPDVVWSEHIESPTWADFIQALNWTEVGIIAIDWATHVTPLSWSDIITAIVWADYVKTFSWSEFVSDLDWVEVAGQAIVWSVYISPLQWSTIIDAFAWADFIGQVDWNNHVTALSSWDTWVTALTWTGFVTAVDLSSLATTLEWASVITSVDLTTFVSTLGWSDFVNDLAWNSYISALDWNTWIEDLGWADHIAALTSWDAWISALAWTSFITNLQWTAFASMLQWTSFIPNLSWGEFVSSINWGTFIPSLRWPSVGDIMNAISGVLSRNVPAFSWPSAGSIFGGSGGGGGGPEAWDGNPDPSSRRWQFQSTPSFSQPVRAASVGAGPGAGGGDMVFHFHGDMHVRSDDDIDRLAIEIAHKFKAMTRR